MTGEELIRQIVLQSKDQPHGRDRGWIVVQLSVSGRDLSLYVKEAGNRGLLKIVNVTSNDSEYDEYKILDITASGLLFLEKTKASRKMMSSSWKIVLVVIAFLGWLIPVVISLWR